MKEFTSVCMEGLLGREGRGGLPSAWCLLGFLRPSVLGALTTGGRAALLYPPCTAERGTETWPLSWAGIAWVWARWQPERQGGGSQHGLCVVTSSHQMGNQGSDPVICPKAHCGPSCCPQTRGERWVVSPGWLHEVLARVGAAFPPTFGDGSLGVGQRSKWGEETGREKHSQMTGRGAWRGKEQDRGPWTCEECQDLKVAEHGLHPHLPGGHCWAVPSGIPAQPGPSKVLPPHRWHGPPLQDKSPVGLSGFPGQAISVACLGSDRGRPPRRLASGRLSAHHCPLHRNSYLWELIGNPLAPKDANSAGSSRVRTSPCLGSLRVSVSPSMK